ncbi:MAG: ribosomal protein S18-alanine N-acetyltransferase [Candidatus Thorarchaeota archaeon]|nr:ribosomal protein S18-alanine N-acetyltransferase [Candidatus Thorarchaeota archaeon]
MEPIIRPVMMQDLSEILLIEEQCFKSPWSPSVFFLLADRQGHVLNREGEISMLVAEVEGQVVAYIVWEYEIRQKRGHLLNIAVQDDYRRRGIAGTLLSCALESFQSTEAEMFFLEVRESNTSARRFYEKMGMASVSRSKRYYEDEDAIIYQVKL